MPDITVSLEPDVVLNVEVSVEEGPALTVLASVEDDPAPAVAVSVVEEVLSVAVLAEEGDAAELQELADFDFALYYRTQKLQ